jgi:hypothetical protein
MQFTVVAMKWNVLMTDSQLPPPKKSWWWTPLIPYVPQPKGTPWYAVNWNITIVFLGPLVLYAALFASGIANWVPERSGLQVLYGKVIRIQQSAPHLLVESPEGNIRSLEFPTFDTIGKQTYFVRDEYMKELIGCNVEIRGVPMHWVLGNNRFRVYELLCNEKNIFVGGLEESERDLISQRKGSIFIFLLIWFSSSVPAFVYVLYRERKYYRE